MDRHRERSRQQIESVEASLSCEQLSGQAPGQPSTRGILEHLYSTYTGTLIVLGFPPLGNRREAPPEARPTGLAVEKFLAEILPTLTEMDPFLSQCAAKFGGRVTVPEHSFLAPFAIDQC